MRLSRLDLNLLPVLHAILSEGSVTKASIRLNLSQAATSNALRRLRETLGDALFVQAGRDLIPTAYALEIADEVGRFARQAVKLSTTRSAFAPETSDRHFVLQMSDYAATVIIGEVTRRIYAEAPHVRLDILDLNDDPFDNLESGRVDVFMLPRWALRPKLASSRLLQDSLSCLVCSSNSRIGETLDLETFQQAEHAVFRHPLFWEGVPSEFGGAAASGPATVSSPSCMLLPQLVMGTDRIAVLPTLAAKRLARAYPLRLLPLPIEHEPLDEWMCWNEDRTCDQAHTWLRNIISDAAAALVRSGEASEPLLENETERP